MGLFHILPPKILFPHTGLPYETNSYIIYDRMKLTAILYMIVRIKSSKKTQKATFWYGLVKCLHLRLDTFVKDCTDVFRFFYQRQSVCNIAVKLTVGDKVIDLGKVEKRESRACSELARVT